MRLDFNECDSDNCEKCASGGFHLGLFDVLIGILYLLALLGLNSYLASN